MALLVFLWPIACAEAPTPLTGLAAMSLTDVLPKVASSWKDHGGGEVAFSFDASGKLAKQVEAGAPADLVVFADAETMDQLGAESLIDPATRRDLLGNSLVVVVPQDATWAPASVADLDVPSLHHLALAGETVPAGRYGKAALTSGGVWAQVEGKVVSGDNVRTTLAWVARGEAEAGVVYVTDALAEPAVRVAFTFPSDSHPPIVYPGAVVAASKRASDAADFLEYCRSPDARALFAAAGFTPLP